MPILPHIFACHCTTGAAFLLNLLFLLILALHLEAYWRLYQRRIRKYFQKQKPKKPRRLRPRSPRDCEACQAGVEVRFFRPRTDVTPYSLVKSRRGCKKTIPTEGYACPNWKCAYFGVTTEALHALVGDGRRGKNRAIQYLKCQACDNRFTSRLNTPLYRLKTDEKTIVLVLMLLAEGCDLSVLVCCTGHAEATVTRWLVRVGRHSRLLHNCLVRDLVLVFVQADELYARVRRVGRMWLWVAIDPISKIIPSIHLGARKNTDAMALLHDVKLRLQPACIPAFTSDGLRSYFYAITAHFGDWFRPARARIDHWRVAEDLLYGQLVKRRRRAATVFAIMRMLWGRRKDLNALLKIHGFNPLIQTAFIARINLTIRRGVAPLMRKTWSLAQTPEHLLLHVEWWRAYYHLVRPHETLALKAPGLGQRRKRSPAMAASLTARLWTVEEVIKLPMRPAAP